MSTESPVPYFAPDDAEGTCLDRIEAYKLDNAIALAIAQRFVFTENHNETAFVGVDSCATRAVIDAVKNFGHDWPFHTTLTALIKVYSRKDVGDFAWGLPLESFEGANVVVVASVLSPDASEIGHALRLIASRGAGKVSVLLLCSVFCSKDALANVAATSADYVAHAVYEVCAKPEWIGERTDLLDIALDLEDGTVITLCVHNLRKELRGQAI